MASLLVRFLLLAGFALLTQPVAAAAAPPTCLTPVGPDEPPCNPHLADSSWGASHRNSYASGSSSFPGPRPGDAIRHQHVTLFQGLAPQVPIVIAFTSPYPDGRRAAFMATTSSPQIEAVHKVDVDSGEVIGTVSQPYSSFEISVSGAYTLLDRDNRLFVARGRRIEVVGDQNPGQRTSPIARLAALDFPDDALCGPDDRLVGINMTYDGHVVFATQRGMVGIVPRDPARFTLANLETQNLNDGGCADTGAGVERVSNSIAIDERGGIFVVTSKRMHGLRWDGTRLRRDWAARYEAGGEATGARLDAGSGSTPDIMGTSRARDRFVVITDGQELMHLVLFWRDAIPADWKPIAPGKDRRIACEVPVRFGDPTVTTSTSEQSVLTSGYRSIIVNNRLRNESVFSALPPSQRVLAAALAGGDPVNAPYGIERIDWDPKTRTCKGVWANRDISIPNAIPTLSTESGLVYSQGQRAGVWGLEGLDLETGASRLWVPLLPLPTYNSLYAATTVGPDGAIWQGVGGGIDIYRGPVRAQPERRCFDLERPTVRATVRGRIVRGVARDTACGAVAAGLRVTVAGRRARVAKDGRFRIRVPGRRQRRVAVSVTDAAGLRSAPKRVRVGAVPRRPTAAPRPRSS
jgi:hypothetical protein